MTSSHINNFLDNAELLDIIQEGLYMRHMLNDDVVVRIIHATMTGAQHEGNEQNMLNLLVDTMNTFDKISQLKQFDILPQDVFMRAKIQLLGILRTCAGLLERGDIGDDELQTLLRNYATLNGEIDFYNELYNENIKKTAAATKAKTYSSH